MDKVSHDKADELATFRATLEALKDKTLTLEAVANEQQHLFKTVKNTDIAALLATAELAVPLSAITLADPIKALGTYDIDLEFGGVKGSVKVTIVSK